MIDGVRARIAQDGYALLSADECSGARDLEPWALVEALIGERPVMLERQTIRPIEGGRSFASNRAATPLHTDSQDFLGTPPALQVMVCRQPAAAGGETILLDAWALMTDLEHEDPALFSGLLTRWRSLRFYFGDVQGPTLARKGNALVFTHSPVAPSVDDSIGRALQRVIETRAVTELTVGRGETLVVDNHRMLHGRRAFDDPRRLFVRFLAWLPSALSAPPRRWVDVADLARSSGPVRSEALLSPPARAVVELLAGEAPAKIAKRLGVPERTLYDWRNAFVLAGEAALAPKRKG